MVVAGGRRERGREEMSAAVKKATSGTFMVAEVFCVWSVLMSISEDDTGLVLQDVTMGWGQLGKAT